MSQIIGQDDMLKELKSQLNNIDGKTIDTYMTKKNVIGAELKRIQQVGQQAARSVLPNDPRQAYKAVKIVQYKKVLGGNVSIYSGRKATGKVSVVHNGGASGIRRNRTKSRRTSQVESYVGKDRAFILNWYQTGTSVRTAGTRGNTSGGSGNRGSLPAHPFFDKAIEAADKSIETIEKAYNEIIDKQFNK